MGLRVPPSARPPGGPSASAVAFHILLFFCCLTAQRLLSPATMIDNTAACRSDLLAKGACRHARACDRNPCTGDLLAKDELPVCKPRPPTPWWIAIGCLRL